MSKPSVSTRAMTQPQLVSSSPSSPSLPPAVAIPVKKGGRRTGTVNWTAAQLDILLGQVRAVLPRGHHEWEQVVSNYNALTGESADYERLHGKFFKLIRTVKPTGKNTKPTHVHTAQQINDEIEAHVFGGEAGEADDDAIDAAAMQMEQEVEREEEKADGAVSISPAPSSSSSPASSRSSSPPSASFIRSRDLHSFPSDRQQNKKPKGGELVDAMQALGAQLSSVVAAQMEVAREEAKLAREQMREEAKLTREQAAQQQLAMVQLIAAMSKK